VTGILSDYEHPLATCSIEFNKAVAYPAAAEGERSGLYIGDFKYLKSLALSSKFITDASILRGVVDCKSLRKLELSASSLTDESLISLVDEMDLDTLKTELCYNFTSDAIRYAKDKMKNRNISINDYNGPMKQSEIPQFMRRNDKSTVQLNRVDVVGDPNQPRSSPSVKIGGQL
jgi:hypothetical protein